MSAVTDAMDDGYREYMDEQWWKYWYPTIKAGYYKVFIQRNVAPLAGEIWWHTAERDEAGDLLEDEGWKAKIYGYNLDQIQAKGLGWISVLRFIHFVSGEPIDKAEFEYLKARRDWAMENADHDPYANPRQKVHVDDMPPMF